MTETVRRHDDLARTIAKLQRRVDSLPMHSHTTHVERWEKTSSQTIPAGTLTAMTTGTSMFGGSSLWTMSAGTITINTAGVYVVNAGVRWDPNNTGYRFSSIRQGAVAVAGDRRRVIDTTASTVSARINAAVSDTIEHWVEQTSGAPLNASAVPQTFIEIELVGRL